MSTTVTVESKETRTWDFSELATALKMTSDLIESAQRYRRERDEIRTLKSEWESHAEGLQERVRDLENALHSTRTHACTHCEQKAATNRKLLEKLDKMKKDSVASRTRSKTESAEDRRQRRIAAEWANSC